MIKKDFNTLWAYRHQNTNEAWTAITVPHDAMISEERTDTAAGGLNVGWFEGRDYEYKKTLTLAKDDLNKKLVLEFEGIYHNAQVFVNGVQCAYRPYGYTNFFVDLDGKVNEGDNEIKVLAFNSDQPNSRWYSGAGIYRPVVLWEGPESYIYPDGIRIETIDAQRGTIKVQADTFIETKSDSKISIEIYDGSNLVAAHLGGWAQWDDVERYLVGTNINLDTAYIRLFIPPEQCLRIIRNHGADKILFGSDSPWEDPADTLKFLQSLNLTEQELALITHQNAQRLLAL